MWKGEVGIWKVEVEVKIAQSEKKLKAESSK